MFLPSLEFAYSMRDPYEVDFKRSSAPEISIIRRREGIQIYANRVQYLCDLLCDHDKMHKIGPYITEVGLACWSKQSRNNQPVLY